MIVVDNTVLADLFFGEGSFRQAAEILAREDPDWISVSLWRYEFGNVLWKLFRASEDSQDHRQLGEAVFIAANKALVETVELLNHSEVFGIASRLDLTFYDASYVWLARNRGLKLRTRDKEVLRKCPDVAVAMPH